MTKIFKKKARLTREQAKEVVDYLVFRSRHSTSLHKNLAAYLEGRDGPVADVIADLLAKVEAGAELPDALLEAGVISNPGRVVLTSGVPMHTALAVVQTLEGDATSFASIYSKTFLSPMLFMLACAFAVFLGQDTLLGVYRQAGDMSAQLGSTTALDIPIYITHSWLLLALTALLGAGLYGLRRLFGWVHTRYPVQLYKVAPWVWYQDWQGVLAVFVALRKAGKSAIAAAQHLADNSSSQLIADALLHAARESRQSGCKFSAALLETGAVPQDLQNFFRDADATGEHVTYLTSAQEYAARRIKAYQAVLGDYAPSIAQALIYLGIGALATSAFGSISLAFMAPMMGG